ncbi:MAG: hypothetical protein V7L29_23875 [Nostoc sp.]|uniref:hypothetical protein n=1 Tax=Nostoc sp. TaxID=1180 RepID=UPI002FFCC04F
MESTLFTTLTPNEEANLSGGNTPKKPVVDPKYILSFLFLTKNTAKASNSVTQTATGGKGGNGGPITIGGGKDSPVVIIKSTISSNGGNGGDATNTSNNAVGASAG